MIFVVCLSVDDCSTRSSSSGKGHCQDSFVNGSEGILSDIRLFPGLLMRLLMNLVCLLWS